MFRLNIHILFLCPIILLLNAINFVWNKFVFIIFWFCVCTQCFIALLKWHWSLHNYLGYLCYACFACSFFELMDISEFSTMVSTSKLWGDGSLRNTDSILYMYGYRVIMLSTMNIKVKHWSRYDVLGGSWSSWEIMAFLGIMALLGDHGALGGSWPTANRFIFTINVLVCKL